MDVMRRTMAGVVMIGLALILTGAGERELSLSREDAQWIGCKIFCNECSGRIDKLIMWNEGEDFMSLGIGHFIWYAKDKKGPFGERFPGFLQFAKKNNAVLPEWLQGAEKYCPWTSREEFLRELESPKMCELRQFVAETVGLQLLYIVKRLNGAVPKILAAAPEATRPLVEEQFYRLAATPDGMYALVDYLNFKGDGTLVAERYNAQGWGLLQVLERMTGTGTGMPAVQEFARAAETVLTERVKNSPPERGEQRWLRGWKQRLCTYEEASKECP